MTLPQRRKGEAKQNINWNSLYLLLKNKLKIMNLVVNSMKQIQNEKRLSSCCGCDWLKARHGRQVTNQLEELLPRLIMCSAMNSTRYQRTCVSRVAVKQMLLRAFFFCQFSFSQIFSVLPLFWRMKKFRPSLL